MSKKIILMLLAICTMCFLISCAADRESDKHSTVSESSSSSEDIMTTEALGEQETEEIAEDDTLPLMIYYNDTVYYLKESFFVIGEEKLHSNDIAENYECIGMIDTFVKINEHPKVNNSCNFGEEAFELYKYSDDGTEFLTIFDGHIQVWQTQEKYNQQ